MTRVSSHALRLSTLAGALALTGCASLDIPQEVARVGQTLPTEAAPASPLVLSQDEAGRRARADLAARLLAAPLGQDDAVRLALAHSPATQALLARFAADLAQARRAGLPRDPVLAWERVVLGDEVEIGRTLAFGLLDLFTLPQRQSIARDRQEQLRLQAAGAVLDQVLATRQAWVRAVAAQQTLAYARQVRDAADASAELARRMQQAGNFNRLQHARQHAFYADATARLGVAEHAALATREALVRQLGLDEAQARQLRLPERLPDLPAQARSPESVTQAALEQRIDWRLARTELAQAGRSARLAGVQAWLDADVTFKQPSSRADGVTTRGRGVELDLHLPLFDWGLLRTRQANARVLAAAHRHDAVAAAATSQLREGYSAYRTAWALARHWRDEVVPLRKTIAEENLLRYNGMQIGVFELLADTREQVGSVIAAIDAQQQFWLADAALSAALAGRPGGPVPASAASGLISATAAPAAADPGH